MQVQNTWSQYVRSQFAWCFFDSASRRRGDWKSCTAVVAVVLLNLLGLPAFAQQHRTQMHIVSICLLQKAHALFAVESHGRCSVDLNLPIQWPLKALSASITCHEFYVAFESFELRDLRVDLRVLQVSLSVGQCNPDSSGTSLTGGFTFSQWNRVALKAS